MWGGVPWAAQAFAAGQWSSGVHGGGACRPLGSPVVHG